MSPEARRAASREPRGRPIPTDLAKGATAIKLLVLDVDGIMTDGRMICGVDGEHMAFHILDGHGIKTPIRSGLWLVIITGPDAVDEVRAAAHYATRRPGGQGAVREAIEVLLKSQGSWSIEMERYQR